ncbi:MAG: DUF1800 domain-containing protein [Saprospiraceae bacterium]|nr:DUF1800 domain-containing protein [Saprospiraceae bacterium]
MIKSLLTLALGCFTLLCHAQPYTDYIGAGHTRNITVSSSSAHSKNHFSKSAIPQNTINGQGLDGKKVEASRFLNMATFGGNQFEIEQLASSNPEAWIDSQLVLPKSAYLALTDSLAQVLYDFYLAQGEDPENISPNPGWQHLRYSWWNNAVYGKDQLRQRMAFALSQILVISDDADIGGHTRGMASYYDMLIKHSFGNYRDLLKDMALHPCMGSYLSHLNNPKEIPEENIHPDQNFAREIMQLFTIGLYELNEDGSRRKDSLGNDIPTYNNTHIAELAKVFTGLGIGASLEGMDDPYFGQGLYGSDLTVPMIMYEDWHQPGEKAIVGDYVIPDGQTGMQDIDDAIQILFDHPNTAPFVVRQLIQRLVTSNPSRDYIYRIVQVWKNDGKGVKGNLAAVVKAILLDPEARACDGLTNPEFGKMMEPVLRLTHLYRAIGVEVPSGYFLNHGYDIENYLLQHPLSSPSVFNFYLPDHQPTGPLHDNNLNAPEFQLLNTLTALEYPNIVFGWTYYENAVNNWENGNFYSPTNASAFFEKAHGDEDLINQVDLLLTNGTMSAETRQTIKEAIKEFIPTLWGAREKINMVLYLTFISPDYMIKK